MDNASKALIIAGAVLIAVMLVSIGVMIYQQAAGVINQGQNNMDALEVSMANQIYTQYMGNRKNRNACAQLLDQAAQQHAANAEHVVAITFTAGTGVTAVPTAKVNGTDKTIQTGADYYDTADELREAASIVRSASNFSYNITSTTDSNGYIDKIGIVYVK